MASSLPGAQQAQAQPTPGVPPFQVQASHVMVTDSVMTSEVAAAAVGQNIVMPNDERILSTVSDLELANGSLIEGIRATTVLSHMSRRLCARSVEARGLAQEVTRLRQRVSALKQEKKQLKLEAKQWKKQRQAMEEKLALYQDCLKTGSANSKEGTKDVDAKCTWLSLSSQGNSNTFLPSGRESVE